VYIGTFDSVLYPWASPTMSARSKCLLLLAVLPLCCWIALGQSRGGNWPTFGGDALRSGWSSADASINRDSVKDLQLLWKVKLEAQSRGARQVMPPVILGRLISYRGFRELGFVATNADIVYSLDVDLGTIFWTKHLEYATREPQIMTSSSRCPGGLTAMPTGSGAARRRGRGDPARLQPAPDSRTKRQRVHRRPGVGVCDFQRYRLHD
jgi:hypothetical protein